MSDSKVDSVPGGSESDDLLSLLSTPISKDYINCVWSVEPMQSSRSQQEGSPKKLTESTSIQSTNTVSDGAHGPDQVPLSEKDSKKTTKSSCNKANSTIKVDSKKKADKKKKTVNKKNIDNKKKVLNAKKDRKAALKKSSLKAKKKLKAKEDSIVSKEDNNKAKEDSIVSKEDNNVSGPKGYSPLVFKSAESTASISGQGQSSQSQSVKRKNPFANVNIYEENFEAAANDEKLFSSHKSLAVSPAIPPYVPKHLDPRFFTGNYFSCKACGDRYVLQTSLFGHMSRKTARFVYKCSFCKTQVSFFNRCTFLLHIMSHRIDCEAIMPGELIVTPLGADEYDLSVLFRNTSFNYAKCPECNRFVRSSKLHFEGKDIFGPKAPKSILEVDTTLKCGVCELILPSSCALAAHRRYHRNEPPHLCPDCGELFLRPSTLLSHMQEICLHYLKRSVATVWVQCGLCGEILKVLDLFTQHMLSKHLRQFFICNVCGISVTDLNGFESHRKVTGNCDSVDYTKCVYFKCDECPGVFIEKDSIQSHIKTHSVDSKFFRTMFQCEACKILLESKELALNHKLSCSSSDASHLLESEVSAYLSQDEQPSSTGPMDTSSTSQNECCTEVCESNMQSDDIHPMNDSPQNGHDLVEKKNSDNNSDRDVDAIQIGSPDSKNHFKQNAVCKLCKKIVAEGVDKAAIRKHFLTEHFNIFMNAVHGEINWKLPMQIVLTDSLENHSKSEKKRSVKLSVKKKAIRVPTHGPKKVLAKNRKRKKDHNINTSPLKIGSILPRTKTENGCYKCYKCSFESDETDVFMKHITTHKSNSSDLQCPECGLCFIVRPPLEKHLIVEHCIKNVDRYLIDHGFEEHVSDVEEETEKEPEIDIEKLEENQCTVCRQKFESVLLLEKHFRVHGGAFLLSKLKAKKPS